jgi:predicted O-methyltransferase YrrM
VTPDLDWPIEFSELPMVDVYLPMMKAAAIISAGQLGLFEALSRTALTVPELAQALGASVSGIEHLSDFLRAVGYLDSSEGKLKNAPHATRWFTRASNIDYTAGLLWTAESWTMMSQLTAAVRKGAPNKTLWESMRERPTWGPAFSKYMHAFAQHLSPDILQHVQVPLGARRLLDLGGSHGLHAIGFCRKHPGLDAVIVDLPESLTDTERIIEKAGLRGRITLRHGNLLDGQWGENYDLALYLSVAHNQTATDNAKVIGEIGRVLNPGGMLVIHEYLTGAPMDAYDAAFRLTLLVETATRTYSLEQYEHWTQSAGFGPVQQVVLTPKEKGSLLVALKR